MMTRRAIVSFALVAAMAVPLAAVGSVLSVRAVGAAAVPGQPRSVSAVPSGSGGAQVTWKAPASDGGSAIGSYLVTPYKGTVALPVQTFLSPKTTEVVRGLKNGKTYRFKVVARNAVGAGPASPLSGGLVVGVPGRPGVPTVREFGDPGEVIVSFARPTGNGDPQVYWTATCVSSNGGATKSSPRTYYEHGMPHVHGLTAGKTYTCTAVASNRFGHGLRSKASRAIKISG